MQSVAYLLIQRDWFEIYNGVFFAYSVIFHYLCAK
jgi:hypothetical protein